MPRHYIDAEWDRDALFASRNLVTVEFAAEQLKVSGHAIEKAAHREQGPLLLWVFGPRGVVMRKYHEVYVDMGPRPGPDLPHAWHGPRSRDAARRGAAAVRGSSEGPRQRATELAQSNGRVIATPNHHASSSGLDYAASWPKAGHLHQKRPVSRVGAA